MSDVRLYEGESPVSVSIDTVFMTVKAIIGAGAEEEFLALSQKEGFTVIAEPRLVNAVKTFLAGNAKFGIESVASAVARSEPGATTCFPVR